MTDEAPEGLPPPEALSPVEEDEAREKQRELGAEWRSSRAAYSLTRDGLVDSRSVATEFNSGPLPAPQVLKEYDAAIPGLGAGLIQVWKEETAHRREMERTDASHRREMDRSARDEFIKSQRATILIERLGLAAAWTIGMSGIFAAYRLAMAGHEATASVIGGVSLASLVAPFLTNVFKRKAAGPGEQP